MRIQRNLPYTHDKELDTPIPPFPTQNRQFRYRNKEIEMLSLPTPLTKLLGPVFEFFQALLAHTGTDIGQTGVEVFDADGPDVFWRHVQQLFAERAQWSHGGVFSESGDVGAGEACGITLALLMCQKSCHG